MLFIWLPYLSSRDLQGSMCFSSQCLDETGMTSRYLQMGLTCPESPEKPLTAGSISLVLCTVLEGGLGGAALITFGDVGQRCQYPLAQTTESLRLLLIVSRNNPYSSCRRDGRCCSSQSPLPTQLEQESQQFFITAEP